MIDWLIEKNVVSMQQTTNCTRKDSGIKKSWMFAIELCIELGSV